MNKKIMRQVMSLGIATSTLLGANFAAFANITTDGGTGSAVVELTAEAPTFSVTVPTSLTVDIDGMGNVTVANNAKIVNDSYGAVKVTDVTVIGGDEWTAVDYETDMSKEIVGKKIFGFNINDSATNAGGDFVFDQASFPVIDGRNDTDSDELAVSYDVKLPAQRDAVAGANIATVTFTIGWYED